MERNLNSFNNFSNQANPFGSFASNPRSENSNFVWVNDTKVSIHDLNNLETIEGLESNQNRAITSYGGGQFGLGQRLQGLRRSGNTTLIPSPEIRTPQSQPARAIVPVGAFPQNAGNFLIVSTDLNSTSSTSTNILSRPPVYQTPNVYFVSNQVAPLNNGRYFSCQNPIRQNPTVFVSNQEVPLNNTTATPSCFLGLSQNPSHHRYPNHGYYQNPLTPNRTMDVVLHQRQVSIHQVNVLNAAPSPHVHTPNVLGKQKRDEQVQAWNGVSLNRNAGNQVNVSANAAPVGNPVGGISGNDGRTRSLARWREGPFTCPRCKLEFLPSHTSATPMPAEDKMHGPAEQQRSKRTTLKSRGRSNHMSHPSDAFAQVQAPPRFKQTSTSGSKVPTDKMKYLVAEALRSVDAEQPGANTASQGDPPQRVTADDQKKWMDYLFNKKE